MANGVAIDTIAGSPTYGLPFISGYGSGAGWGPSTAFASLAMNQEFDLLRSDFTGVGQGLDHGRRA